MFNKTELQKIIWNGFDNAGDVEEAFECIGALDGATVVYAFHSYEYYSGDATVWFERGGKLWEVTGSHCSCYGFEGQWEPGHVTLKSLRCVI